MNRYATAVLLSALSMTPLVHADELDGLFDNSIVSSISQAINDAYNPNGSQNRDDEDRRPDEDDRQRNSDDQRRYEDRHRQLEDRRRQLDDQQRQLEDDERRLDDDFR